MPETTPPRVFISYSHDSEEHRARVLALADRLRADGIDAIIDQYVMAPPEGWPSWCEAEINKARFALLVCTEIYYRRVQGNEQPGKGHGVLWEARLIKQHIYDSASASSKFVPVQFAEGLDAHVPLPVKGTTVHRVDTEQGYEALCRLLTNQHATPAPPLGERRSLPPRQRQSGPFSTAQPEASPPAPPSPPPASPPPTDRLAVAPQRAPGAAEPAAAPSTAAVPPAQMPPLFAAPLERPARWSRIGKKQIWLGLAALPVAAALLLLGQHLYVSQHRYGREQVAFAAGTLQRPVANSPLLAVLRRHLSIGNLNLLIEAPPVRQPIGAYFIDRVEVTNGDFRKFLTDQKGVTIAPPDFWNDPNFNQPDQPVVGISWKSADAYCRARGKRLPTGDEWERAARGTDGRLYPWGNTFDRSLTNTGEAGRPGPVRVGSIAGDRSVDGVLDTAGNVSEWTAEDGVTGKVIRGGSWSEAGELYSLAFLKIIADPEVKTNYLGFRCAADVAGRTSAPPDMVAIDAGTFQKGSEDNPLLNLARKFRLDTSGIRALIAARPVAVAFLDFGVDRYEVSNRQYAEFVDKHPIPGDPPFADLPNTKKSYQLDAKIRGNAGFNRPDQPVVGVDWYDARAYCQWRGGRLPSSDEWERTAGGFDGLAYPWGPVFDPARCNTADSTNGAGATADVTKFPGCSTANGVLNLVGNADEWTDTNAPDSPNGESKVIRGGSWAEAGELRGFNGLEAWAEAGYRGLDVGFRCAANPQRSWIEKLAAWLF